MSSFSSEEAASRTPSPQSTPMRLPRTRTAPRLDPLKSPFYSGDRMDIPALPIEHRELRRTKTVPANALDVAKDSWEIASPDSAGVRSVKSCRHFEDRARRRSSRLRKGAETTKACFVSKERDFGLPPSIPSTKTRSDSNAGCRRRESSTSKIVIFAKVTPNTPSTATSSTASARGRAAPKDQDDQDGLARINKWRCGSKIGQGSYGCVNKALDEDTGQIFAVKKAVIQQGSDEDSKYADKFEDELEIFRCLRHPNIVSFLGHEIKDGELCIFMEYVPGGSLAAMVVEFGALDGKLLRQATLGMLQGLEYLHSHSPPVIHRDIKGANVLVDKDFGIKLTDFGCSKRCDISTSFTTIGSIPWMAPEVIHQQTGYGRKADIWSLGCTVVELATAETPWGKAAFDNVMFALKRIGLSEEIPPVPEDMAPGLQELVMSCFRRNADARPSASELIYHDFFLGRVCGSATALRRARQARVSPTHRQ